MLIFGQKIYLILYLSLENLITYITWHENVFYVVEGHVLKHERNRIGRISRVFPFHVCTWYVDLTS